MPSRRGRQLTSASNKQQFRSRCSHRHSRSRRQRQQCHLLVKTWCPHQGKLDGRLRMSQCRAPHHHHARGLQPRKPGAPKTFATDKRTRQRPPHLQGERPRGQLVQLRGRMEKIHGPRLQILGPRRALSILGLQVRAPNSPHGRRRCASRQARPQGRAPTGRALGQKNPRGIGVATSPQLPLHQRRHDRQERGTNPRTCSKFASASSRPTP